LSNSITSFEIYAFFLIDATEPKN